MTRIKQFMLEQIAKRERERIFFLRAKMRKEFILVFEIEKNEILKFF
jgi:hypothetical protein